MNKYRVTKPSGQVVEVSQSGKWDAINWVRQGATISYADMPNRVLEEGPGFVKLEFDDGVYRSEIV
jgi:hypothetical protein